MRAMQQERRGSDETSQSATGGHVDHRVSPADCHSAEQLSRVGL